MSGLPFIGTPRIVRVPFIGTPRIVHVDPSLALYHVKRECYGICFPFDDGDDKIDAAFGPMDWETWKAFIITLRHIMLRG